jgi:hypothetical protein
MPGFGQRVIEVRQVQEFPDFPADVQEAAAKLPELQSGRGAKQGFD